MHFSTFSTDFVDWNTKKVNNERMCCLKGFFKEINTVFKVKMSKINTENDKKQKVSISKVFMHFIQVFDKLCRLEQ